jgi:hypothetical protein
MIWFFEKSLVIFIMVLVIEQVSLRQSMPSDQITKDSFVLFLFGFLCEI